MHYKRIFSNNIWQIVLGNSLLRNHVRNKLLLPKYIHTVFSPININWRPHATLSNAFHSVQSLPTGSEGSQPNNSSRACVRSFSDGSLAEPHVDSLSFSAAHQKAILEELNAASYEALCSYGFRATVALALEQQRPFQKLVEVLKVAGVGYGSLMKACQRVHEVVQQKKDPVQPSVTLSWAQKFTDVVSVCVVPGYVAYAHLALCPARSNPSIAADGQEEDPAPLGEELLRGRAFNSDSVEVLALDLLPVETSDPKLHPHKLLQKVQAALYEVPECSVYVMPVCGVMMRAGMSATEAAISVQRAQVMGAVQGHLAQRCSLQPSEICYIRDAVVQDVFSLRVGKDIVTNRELLRKLLNGSSPFRQLQTSFSVPRLTMAPDVEQHFTALGGSLQRTVAPALYTGLLLCSVVAATRKQ